MNKEEIYKRMEKIENEVIERLEYEGYSWQFVQVVLNSSIYEWHEFFTKEELEEWKKLEKQYRLDNLKEKVENSEGEGAWESVLFWARRYKTPAGIRTAIKTLINAFPLTIEEAKFIIEQVRGT
jgi:hypothetical protein